MLLETLRLAFQAIWRNALRSLLTLLGVTIGVAAVISMVTLGQGATAEVSSSISSLGSDVIMVIPGSFASFTSGVDSMGCNVNMASGLSRPSRVLKKARIGDAGWLKNPFRAVM